MKTFELPESQAGKAAAIGQNGHAPFSVADQPAPCPGYFENDVLPCVYGAAQDVLHALQQVQVPAAPVVETGRAVAAAPGRLGQRSKPGSRPPKCGRQPRRRAISSSRG
jgi:hypothetical protein